MIKKHLSLTEINSMISFKIKYRLSTHGFTLVELGVVLAIVAVLAAIATPVLFAWLPNVRLNGAARDLYATIMKAKGEAAKHNSRCTLTFNQTLPDGITYAYVLFVDNAPSNSSYDAGEAVLLRVQQWPQGVTLDPAMGGGDGLSFPNRGPGCAGNPALSFGPNALPVNDACGLANGTAFLIKASDIGILNRHTKNVAVNITGNVSID